MLCGIKKDRKLNKNNTSGIRRVHFDKDKGLCVAQIMFQRKVRILGRFKTKLVIKIPYSSACFSRGRGILLIAYMHKEETPMNKKAKLSGILSLVLVLSNCGFNDVIDVSYGSSDGNSDSNGNITNKAFYIEENYINVNYNLIADSAENYSYQLNLVKRGKYEGKTITYTFDPDYLENVSNDGLFFFNVENLFSVKSFSVIASVEDGSSD